MSRTHQNKSSLKQGILLLTGLKTTKKMMDLTLRSQNNKSLNRLQVTTNTLQRRLRLSSNTQTSNKSLSNTMKSKPKLKVKIHTTLK